MADPTDYGLTTDEFRGLQEAAVGLGRKGVDVTLRGDDKSSTSAESERQKRVKEFAALLKDRPNSNPTELGKALGLDEATIAAVVGDSSGKSMLRDLGPVKDTSATLKERQAFNEAAANDRAKLTRQLGAADALRRVEESEKDSSVSQIGTSLVSSGARIIDKLTEGAFGGEGLLPAKQADLATLDTAGVFQVGEVSELWKGAISDYESRMFKSTVSASDKPVEFNRDQGAVRIFAFSASIIKNRFVDEMRNTLSKDSEQISPSSSFFNTSALNAAMEYVQANSGLPSLDEYEPGSPEKESAAREWADFAQSSNASRLIKEAILLANVTRDPNSNTPVSLEVSDMRDPARLRPFLDRMEEDGLLQPMRFNDDDEARAWLKKMPADARPKFVVINGKKRPIK